ncbi:hypothetical protein RMT79_000216 [Enterobacter kobei]|nr:hypothetical protein [Enterobacter kobei]
MSNIDKQWLQQKIAAMECTRDEIPFGLDEDDSNTLAAMRIALASLEAEAVVYVDPLAFHNFSVYRAGETDNKRMGREWMWANPDAGLIPVYTAQPAQVSVPDEIESTSGSDYDDYYCDGWNACRAAMLQGAENEIQRKASIHDALCEKYSVESLADFVDWQRNHIAELEAAPPAPVGEGETAVMPDYPGYVMTQRECFQAGKKAGLDEAGNSPVIPDGWVMVPVEPTEDMAVQGFESEPDESFSDDKEWEKYAAMSGCQQAAHRAKLCWAAMIAAALKIDISKL